MDKAELRRYIRSKKQAMTAEQIAQKSEKLAKLFLALPQYRQAKTLYGYLSYNQEVRTEPILEQALRDGKRVAVPKIFGEEMRFIYLEDLSKVEKGYRGIPEPVETGAVAREEDALVLMPGLAFDRAGRRIGYGGGFYDKFLAKEPHHPTVALCYDFQVFNTVAAEETDIPVELVLWS